MAAQSQGFVGGGDSEMEHREPNEDVSAIGYGRTISRMFNFQGAREDRTILCLLCNIVSYRL